MLVLSDCPGLQRVWGTARESAFLMSSQRLLLYWSEHCKEQGSGADWFLGTQSQGCFQECPETQN